MNILVLNGSPKGDLSVTMQYVAFLQSMNPHHSLKIINIAQQIRQIEQSEEKFKEPSREPFDSSGTRR